MKKLFILAIVVLGFTAVSFGVGPLTTKTANAAATMASTISIDIVDALNFGVISIPSDLAVSTVSIAANGTRANVTGLAAPLNYGVTPKAGSFLIKGVADAAITVTVPTTITLTNGLTVTTARNTITKLSGFGDETLTVFGTLNIPASVAGGVASGTYDVSVNYN